MRMFLKLKRWPLWLQLTLILFGTSLLVAFLVGNLYVSGKQIT